MIKLTRRMQMTSGDHENGPFREVGISDCMLRELLVWDVGLLGID
jgi:hypothetical protein